VGTEKATRMIDFAVERVIIACDAVAENRAGIEAAANLAALWKAALHALLLEDESLLNLAGLPFARQVGLGGSVGQGFEEADIVRHFEAHMRRVREEIEKAARAHAVASSVSVVRGRPSAVELPIDEHDLLVIEETTRPFGGQFRLASRWLSAALQVRRPVLLVRSRAALARRVVSVVQAKVPSSLRAAAAAAKLASAAGLPLILRIVDEAASPAEVRAWVAQISPGLGTQCRIETAARGAWPFADGEDSLLVVDADPAVNELAVLKALVARSRADILYVR